MRVGVNLESLRPGQIGGLESYVRQLLAELANSFSELELILLCAPYNVHSLAELGDLDRVQLIEISPQDFARLDSSSLASYEFDLWFCPLLVLEPSRPGIPSVVTVPDLQHHRYPEFFSTEILEWRQRNYSRTIASADHILTLSRASRQMLEAHLGADPHRITVCHLDSGLDIRALPNQDREAARARLGLPDRFLFYPANNWAHKNHRLLFEAIARLARESEVSAELVLSGATIEDAIDLDALSNEFEVTDHVHHLGFLPAKDLVEVYQLSEATVLPSLFEGFGLPMLEAMRSSSPVLASSATSYPEIGSRAALYFDPNDPEELVELLRVVYLPDRRGEWLEQRKRLIAAGHDRAHQFSWTETARLTYECFRKVLDPEPHRRSSTSEPLPSIAIVTPSFNQAHFIPETIESVLGQDHRPDSYLVVDGGSTDDTVNILERYRAANPDVFEYISESDDGQAAAVNKGFDRASSEIVGWLNSDDLYEPGCLEEVAKTFRDHPETDVVYGRAHYIDEQGEIIGIYPTRNDFDWQVLAHECYVCQPTVFIRRRVLDNGYRLDEDLQMCMDYDFWIRLGQHLEVRFIDRILASSRLHTSNKTISQRSQVYREIFTTVKRHYGRLPLSWALGRAHHVWDRGDPFFNVRPLRATTFLIAAALLFGYNATSPGAWRSTWNEVRHHLAAKLGKS